MLLNPALRRQKQISELEINVVYKESSRIASAITVRPDQTHFYYVFNNSLVQFTL